MTDEAEFIYEFLPGPIERRERLSLRDWFAGQALLSIVIHDTEESRSYDDVARMSYEQADAMMAARSKEKEE